MNALTLEHPTGSVLVAYGLGQLDETELADIDAHLAECDLCRQVVEGVAPDTLLTLLRSAATDPDSTRRATASDHPTGARRKNRRPALAAELARPPALPRRRTARRRRHGGGLQGRTSAHGAARRPQGAQPQAAPTSRRRSNAFAARSAPPPG